MWTKIADIPPPPYTNLLVIHEGQRKVLRHEGGWFYGTTKDSVKFYYNNAELTTQLNLIDNHIPK